MNDDWCNINTLWYNAIGPLFKESIWELFSAIGRLDKGIVSIYLFMHTMVISILPDVIRGGNYRVIHDTLILQYGVQVSVSRYKRICNVILQDILLIILYYLFNCRGKLFSKWPFIKK